VAIQAGRNQVTEPARDSYSVQDVVVGAPLPAVAAPAAPARIMTWTSSRRVVRVTASTRSYLVVNENFNPGWRAVIDGRPLRAVRLDGWKQAWLLPAGTAGVVTLTYPPNAIYQGAILAGLSALALALLVAARPWGWARRRSGPPPAAVAVPTPAAPTPALPTPAVPTPAAPSGRRPLRRTIVRVMAWPMVAGGLALAGLWLGGYPGAVLLPVAAGVFLGVSRGSRGRLAGPWLLAGLMLAAAAAGAMGQRLVLSGGNGPVALWLADGIPQVICLLIIGGLAAALLRPEPGYGQSGPGQAGPGQRQVLEALGRALDQVVADGGGGDGEQGHRQPDGGDPGRCIGPPGEHGPQVQQAEERIGGEELP
jgi:arabinofuranan 3-O-arabinosyltransferase